MSPPTPDGDRADDGVPPRLDGLRVAILSPGQGGGGYDARALRIAGSVRAAGGAAVLYARWEPGLAADETIDGTRVVRLPTWTWAAVPGTGWLVRRRLVRWRTRAAAAGPAATRGRTGASGKIGPAPATASRADPLRRLARPVTTAWRQLRLFPVRPLGWAAAVTASAEPADLWHGMWAASLPALGRLRERHGGHTIYDSRDLYLHARGWEHVRGPVKALVRLLERRWARAADAVVTVNDPYADVLARELGIGRPIVVRNTPGRWHPPSPPPDRIRAALGLGPGTRIVLYQGGLMTERGIEQGMEAIHAVPDAALVLMGFGGHASTFRALAAQPRHAGRVHLLPPVPPAELLDWTASADVMLMAIQPTSLNHRLTTPQKLWEAIAAGVPVVAGDLPGMAEVVRATDCGVLCDPVDPESIAAAVRTLLDEPPEARAARRSRILAVAHARYHWDAEVARLLDGYRELVDPAGRSGGDRVVPFAAR